jgi:hypothetical protein
VFDPSNSTTFAYMNGTPPLATIYNKQYGTASVKLVLGQDDAAIENGLVVKNQTFGLSTTESGVPSDVDGLIGLSFQSLSAWDTYPSFLNNMQAQGIIQRRAFAAVTTPLSQMGLNETTQAYYTIPSGGPPVGEVSLGGVNPKLYGGEIAWLKLISTVELYWNVRLTNLWVGNEDVLAHIYGVNGSKQQEYKSSGLLSRLFSLGDPHINSLPGEQFGLASVVDTGTGNILLPRKVATYLLSLLGGFHIPMLDLMVVKCADIPQMPAIRFTMEAAEPIEGLDDVFPTTPLGPQDSKNSVGPPEKVQISNSAGTPTYGYEFTLPSTLYTNDDSIFGYCTMSFAGWDGQGASVTSTDVPNVILGEAFIEHFYSVFDMDGSRIGLAPPQFAG